jgi:hypothetical protein
VAERDHMGNGHRYRGGVTAMAHTGAVAGCHSNTWYATHVREGGMHSHTRGCNWAAARMVVGQMVPILRGWDAFSYQGL